MKNLIKFIIVFNFLMNVAFSQTTKLFDYKFTDINGNAAQLDKEEFNETDKVLVMFWGSWCKDCKTKLITTLPDLPNKGKIKVLTINMDGNSKRAIKYINENDIKIPVLREVDKTFSSQFKVFAVPHWVVLDKNVEGKDNWNIVDHAPAFDEQRISKALNLKDGKL